MRLQAEASSIIATVRPDLAGDAAADIARALSSARLLARRSRPGAEPWENDGLSDDARCVLGGWFGMGTKTVVELALRQSRPTLRTYAALVELESHGLISRTPRSGGGECYTPHIDARPYMRWIQRNKKKAKWPIMEPVR